ncbi:MAG: response regulator [Chloroflexi bacterium]|nr:response regulator [Chloroflexota bacterium]
MGVEQLTERTAGTAKILFVEDEFLVRQLVRVTLERAGYEVFEAEDIRTAKRIIEAEHPAPLILDIKLPGSNGWDLVTVIKADPAHVDAKIIMVTGSHADSDRLRAQEFMVDAYLAKPFSPWELIHTVRQVLGSS